MEETIEKLLEAVVKLGKSEKGSTEVFDLYTKTAPRLTENNFLFVYGSLRKGQYNYKRIRSMFGPNCFCYIESIQIKYARLFDLGQYPAVMGGGYYDVVNGELMFCSDEAFKYLKDMELNAGYRLTFSILYYPLGNNSYKPMNVPYYIANSKLISMILENRDKYTEVKHGDWVRYIEETICVE